MNFSFTFCIINFKLECRAVARHDSGNRVSNTLVTYPEDGNKPAKAGLIPNVVGLMISGPVKMVALQSLLQEGPAAYQLVGEVMAHQGDDGYEV